MKTRIFGIIIFIISLASCSQKNKNEYDIVNFNRVTSEKDSLKEMRVIYESNVIQSLKMIRTYYNDGSLLGIGYFRNQKRDGLWQHFLNSKVAFEGAFLNGKKVGLHKYYHSNGKPSMIEEYNNDKIINKSEYLEDGSVIYSKKY